MGATSGAMTYRIIEMPYGDVHCGGAGVSVLVVYQHCLETILKTEKAIGTLVLRRFLDGLGIY
jgi:hypothetical protein